MIKMVTNHIDADPSHQEVEDDYSMDPCMMNSDVLNKLKCIKNARSQQRTFRNEEHFSAEEKRLVGAVI